MSLVEDLARSGLSKQESAVYLYLLEAGHASPPQVARGASMLRPNTYAVLTSLKNKGLVEAHHKGKRYLYSAKDPSALLHHMDDERQTMANILPDLVSLYKSQTNKPSIRFYYGMEEVRDMFLRTDDARELLFVTTADSLYATYPSIFKKYREELFHKQVFVRDILTQRSGTDIAQTTRAMMRGYYDARFLPRKIEDVPTSIRIWGDYVGLVTFDEPVTGTVIQSAALAKTFKTMFEVMWSAGERLS